MTGSSNRSLHTHTVFMTIEMMYQVLFTFPFEQTIFHNWRENGDCRGVEIPCTTCPTWSHYIQDKLRISIYFINKVNAILCFIFNSYYELTMHACCMENSVLPDQLASEEAS